MIRFEALLTCYRTGQMSEAQLQEHMREDAIFAAWVRRQIRSN
jgi:hypothetical protein